MSLGGAGSESNHYKSSLLVSFEKVPHQPLADPLG